MSEAVTAETNHGRKVHLLKGLMDARSTLTVTWAGLSRPVTTALVEVLPETDQFIFDEFIPRAANDIAPNTPIFVQGKLKGVLVEFQTIVLRSAEEGKFVSHYCAMPGEVVYHQKRREFRLRAPALHRMGVSLAHEDSSTSGRLIDISVGGTNVELKELPEWAEEDQHILCALDLGDDLRIETDAVIRHVAETNLRQSQVHRLGLQLLSLTPVERRKLRQWINLVERRRARFD